MVGVRICSDNHDVLLTSASGRAIRFNVLDIRLFKGRDSNGVRGIKLGSNDRLVSMGILDSTDITSEERPTYLKMATALRRSDQNDDDTTQDDERIQQQLFHFQMNVLKPLRQNHNLFFQCQMLDLENVPMLIHSAL